MYVRKFGSWGETRLKVRRWAKKKLDMRIRKFYLKPWDGEVLWPMK